MSYENVEFEFILDARVKPIHDILISQDVPNYTKVLECSINESVLAYQTWSLKTVLLNEEPRKMFSMPIGQFLYMVDNNPEYQPRTVLTFGTNEIDIFTTVKIINGNNSNENGNFVMYLLIDESNGSKVTFTEAEHVKLNFSSLPYYMINVNNSLYPVPFGDNTDLGAISPAQFNKPLYNYILREIADIIIKDGIINLTIYNKCNLIKYQQWSASTKALNANREGGCISMSNFMALFENPEEKFQPTVSLKIGNKFFIGVMKNINMSDHAENDDLFNKFSFNNNNSTLVTIEIDTTQMVDIDNNPITVEDATYEKDNIYMNIDDNSDPMPINVSDVITQDGVIHSGQILNLPDVNDNYLINKDVYGSSNSLTNNGTINILPYNTTTQANRNTTIGKTYRKKHITTSQAKSHNDSHHHEDVIEYMTSIHVPKDCTFNNSGTINISNSNSNYTNTLVIPNDSKTITDSYINVSNEGYFLNTGQFILDDAVTVNTNHDFSVITKVENQGVMRFNTIENASNDFSMTEGFSSAMPTIVCGIHTLLNTMLKEPTATTPSTVVYFSKITTTGQNATTAGIVKCISNNGSISIENVINGEDNTFVIPTGLNNHAAYNLPLKTNGNQNTYGIIYMGDINPTFKTSDKLYEQLTKNKHFINYQLLQLNNIASPNSANWDSFTPPTLSIKPTDSDIISNVSGNGGVIYINNIANYSQYDNTMASVSCAGVMNCIQVRDDYVSASGNMALLSINRIINYGYGGSEACMGMENLLLNCSAVKMNLIENWTPNDYVNDTGPSGGNSMVYGIKQVVQNGFSGLKILNPDRYTSYNKEIYSFLPPYPPENFETNGSPSLVNDNVTIQLFNDTDGTYIPKSEKVMYDQGHISIGLVNNLGASGSLSQGINQYGCLSYNNDAMDANSLLNTTADVTSQLFSFVEWNNKFATAWSFPTPNNLQTGFGLIPNDLSADDLTTMGWFPKVGTKGGYGPSQMYYVWDQTKKATTQCINFPMNWGIVTINSINAGYKDGTYINKSGSSYGMERLLSSMGRIQILNITSSNPQKDQSSEVNTVLRLNTPDQPELSQDLGIGTYQRLPINYVKSDTLTKIGNDTLNDLPVTIAMSHNYVIDPTGDVIGTWTSKTSNTINYRNPYSIAYNTYNNYYTSPSMKDFEMKFVKKNTPHDSNDPSNSSPFNFNKLFPDSGIGKGGGKNVLPELMSEGASYGILRTLDYGSTAPGLRTLVDYSTPLKESNEFNDYLDGWAPQNVAPIVKPTELGLINYLAWGGIGFWTGVGGVHFNIHYGTPGGGEERSEVFTAGTGINHDSTGSGQNFVSFDITDQNGNQLPQDKGGQPLKYLVNLAHEVTSIKAGPDNKPPIKTNAGWLPILQDTDQSGMSQAGGMWWPSNTHLNLQKTHVTDSFFAIPNQGGGNTSTKLNGHTLFNGPDCLPGTLNDTEKQTMGIGLNPSYLPGGWSQFSTYWGASIDPLSNTQMPATGTVPYNTPPKYLDTILAEKLGINFTQNNTVVPYPRIWNSELEIVKQEKNWVSTGNLTLYERTLPFSVLSDAELLQLSPKEGSGIIQPYAKGYSNPFRNSVPPIGPENFTDGEQPKQTSHLWNIIQNGTVTPPKYTWTFETNTPYINKLLTSNDYVAGLVSPNLFPSAWPGMTNLPALLTTYMNANLAIYGAQQGYGGPYAEYKPFRINEATGKEEYMEEFMPCFYSTLRPAGTGNQYIQGGIMYFVPGEPGNEDCEIYTYMDDEQTVSSLSLVSLPNTEILSPYTPFVKGVGNAQMAYNIKADYNKEGYEFYYNGGLSVNTFKTGLTGFSTITKGSGFLVPLNPQFIPSNVSVPGTTYNESLMYNEIFSLDEKCTNKYDTRNSYYGFSVEYFTQSARIQYNQHYGLLGPYQQYESFNNFFPSLAAQNYEKARGNYIQAQQAKANAAKASQEALEKKKEQANKTGGYIKNAVMGTVMVLFMLIF